ncbi:MAG: ribonuclease PH, partial [Dolichospermum sp.]
DLNYIEDVSAEVDFNVVMNDKMQIIEVQGTAEAGSFSRQQLNQILDFSEQGIQQLLIAQRNVINDWHTLFMEN